MTEFESEVIADVRDLVLKLARQLEAGPPSTEAVTIAGLLHDLRGPLCAAEHRVGMAEAARSAGREVGWEKGFAFCWQKFVEPQAGKAEMAQAPTPRHLRPVSIAPASALRRRRRRSRPAVSKAPRPTRASPTRGRRRAGWAR